MATKLADRTNYPLYSLLARRCPADHVIAIGRTAAKVNHECIAIKRLKLLKVRRR